MALSDPHRENARKAAAPGGITPGHTASQPESDDTEAELTRIIDTAVARVAEVERDAIRQSRRLTQGVEYEGREALKQAQDRAFQLANSLEVLTVTISDMVDALHVELDDSVDALRKVRAPEQAIADEPAPDEPAPEEPAPVAASPNPSPAPLNGGEQRVNGGAAEPHVEQVSPAEPSSEMTEMFREQILNMKRSGKSREEAKRSLLRFNLGRRFVGLLDEVYAEDASEPPPPAAKARSKGAVRRLFSRS